MLKYLILLLMDNVGGLGLTQGSIMSSVLDDTGDDSDDAQTKVGRLINRKGKQFCAITNWHFLRDAISFTIQASDLAYKYSGAGYLPTTFKRVVAARLIDSNNRVHDLNEVSITEAYDWELPSENTDRPIQFAITRIESGFWEIWFNKQPDDTYTIEFEVELQWTNVSSSTDETIITLPFEDAFVHYISMARLKQQGDTEAYSTFKAEWSGDPRTSIMSQAISLLSKPTNKTRGMIMRKGSMIPTGSRSQDIDYDRRGKDVWA